MFWGLKFIFKKSFHYSSFHTLKSFHFTLVLPTFEINQPPLVKYDVLLYISFHLMTIGKTSWIYNKPYGHYTEDGWEAIDLVSTTEGTTPEGSQWAKMDLPRKPQNGDYWAWRDLVEVPESLAPGEYVLSFRWDCQQTPQVWNACANIQVV